MPRPFKWWQQPPKDTAHVGDASHPTPSVYQVWSSWAFLPVSKIWPIFGHSVKQRGDLDFLTFWPWRNVSRGMETSLPCDFSLSIFMGKHTLEWRYDLITLTSDHSPPKWGDGLSVSSWTSYLPIFSLLHSSTLDLGSGTGQTDRQIDNDRQRLMSSPHRGWA